MDVLSKLKGKSQNVPVEHKPKELDVIFAHLRRLERDMNESQSKVSTLRRDINRLDRMVYRQAEPSGEPPTKEPVAPSYIPEPYRYLFRG